MVKGELPEEGSSYDPVLFARYTSQRSIDGVSNVRVMVSPRASAERRIKSRMNRSDTNDNFYDSSMKLNDILDKMN
jgi:hypothetical protein